MIIRFDTIGSVTTKQDNAHIYEHGGIDENLIERLILNGEN
jgi:hypothetical protein